MKPQTRRLAIFPVLLTALLGFQIEAENVFVELDDEGVPTFSDQRTPGAQEIEIPETMTFPGAAALQERKPAATTESTPPVDAKYKRLEITEPENGAAIRENSGALTLNVLIDPALKPGHKGELLMDGTVIQAVNGSGPIALTNVDRGTHLFLIRVVNKKGKVISQSTGTTVSLLRHFKPAA